MIYITNTPPGVLADLCQSIDDEILSRVVDTVLYWLDHQPLDDVRAITILAAARALSRRFGETGVLVLLAS